VLYNQTLRDGGEDATDNQGRKQHTSFRGGDSQMRTVAAIFFTWSMATAAVGQTSNEGR